MTMMRLNEVAVQSHVDIERYNVKMNVLQQVIQCPEGINGPLDWDKYVCPVSSEPSISKIKIAINAGWSSEPGKEAITNLDLILMKATNNDRIYEADFINLLSDMNLSNVSNLVDSETGATDKFHINSSDTIMGTVYNFTKINPTFWTISINENMSKTNTPWTLAFAEAYDPLWQAQVYQNGTLLQVVNSKPLYGAINGFEIDSIPSKNYSQSNGNFEIVIEYVPQGLFETGIKISLVILLILLIYLIFVSLKYRKKAASARATKSSTRY
jgi:hypothetical protein